MNKKELFSKCEQYRNQSLHGVFVIQERRLHDSGYRLMNVIGHSKYDEEINDYHYYLLSACSDVIDFGSFYHKNSMRGVHIDINKHGIIHIWTHSDEKFVCPFTNCSSCVLDNVGGHNES